MTRLFQLCLVLGFTAVPCAGAFADSPFQVLNENSRMCFCDTRLGDVAVFLSRQHGIQFALAPNVDGNERITFDADGPLAALLGHLLRPMHLEYRPQQDSILIRPIDEAMYAKGLRERAEQEHSARELERRARNCLDAPDAHLIENELGWITDVRLRGASVADSQAATLRHFSRLSRLELSGTAITDRALKQLKGLGQLSVLAVDGTLITDAGLPHLKALWQLKTLDASNTRITDDGLAKLADIPTLRIVFVEGTDVTSEGIARLHESAPAIRVFTDRPVKAAEIEEDRD